MFRVERLRTPWPGLAKTLMVSTPRLISWRTSLRRASGPSAQRSTPGVSWAFHHGPRLFMSPVVPMWWPQARMRGPGMMS